MRIHLPPKSSHNQVRRLKGHRPIHATTKVIATEPTRPLECLIGKTSDWLCSIPDAFPYRCNYISSAGDESLPPPVRWQLRVVGSRAL